MSKQDSIEWFLSLPILQSDILKQEFAFQLESILKKENITKKEFAKKLKKTPSWVSKVLRGDENLTIETMCKLVETIGYKFHSFSISKETSTTQIWNNITTQKNSNKQNLQLFTNSNNHKTFKNPTDKMVNKNVPLAA